MCLAADVPLIESGTTGFNGQVQVIKRGVSECYDCNPKETPKTFPVCTIRSTPSQPIHCIVWAKSYLFAEIFGTSEDEAPDLDTTEDSDNAAEIEKLRAEANALKRIRESMGSEDFPRQVFDKVFKDDIERLRSMEDMWKMRKKPEALDFDQLMDQFEGVNSDVAQQDQAVWTDVENFAVFVRSLHRLSDRLDEMRANAETGNATPVLSFDKDDKDTLDFVASAANLRSLIFNIERKSEFEIKRKLMQDPMLTITDTYRNGRQHHPCHCDDQRNDCIPLRPTITPRPSRHHASNTTGQYPSRTSRAMAPEDARSIPETYS